ncbi:hypothetical protein EDD98_5765 [Streptomyces sp. PanSC19]|uniref:hypothetical protein n=1 Tax=Streptomyces sp. PanSC19 TaxID=1520455 RepID=UPI000F4A392B|nr:hypothetical protein [Streptomyces sp. PanSC19]ROQ26153.1 hypothetical protein EDD98_5765 [Streptomyces sp. PanSC19]
MSEPFAHGTEQPPPSAGKPPRQDGGDLYGPSALVKIVVAQGTFIAALMFYIGAIYTSTYYAYFNLRWGSLNLGFSQVALESLNLLNLDIMVAVGCVALLVCVPWSRRPRRVPRIEAAAARWYPLIVVVGIVLLALWQEIQPYGWTGPLTIAVGLILSQCRDAEGRRPQGFRRQAVPVFAAGVFLFWTVTNVAWQQGRQDAQAHAADVTRWTGVLVLSTKPLSFPTGSVREQKLPNDRLHPYRYSDLRLLTEHDGRYFVVPRNWNAQVDEIYVVRESETIWIALTPGTRPRLMGWRG